jgi:GDP-L-fucose synthase
MPFDLRGRRIFVTGHRGMIGSALVRRLAREPCEVLGATRAELDLTRQSHVEEWFDARRPDAVVHCAARVGGIEANDRFPADFIYDNIAIATNVIHAAWKCRVSKLVFLAAACIYPRAARQPLNEHSLLTGPLEPTNEPFAVAKIAGLKLCQAYRRQHGSDFVTVIPANAYGPGDNFNPERSHVIAALLRRAHEARLRGEQKLTVWGTGEPRRDFIYVDDVADGVVHMLRHYSAVDPVNLGSGTGVSIGDLARQICDVAGFRGSLEFDRGRPDGMPVKVLDVTRMRGAGWAPATALRDGLRLTCDWYAKNAAAEG